jgi:hypothetical protein
LTSSTYPMLPEAARSYRCYLCAELVGSDTCTAGGLTVQGNAPILAMCRRLTEAGVDPARPLHAYRGATLCLTVRSIGEAAGLDVGGDGTGFVKHHARVRAAPPIAPRAGARVISIPDMDAAAIGGSPTPLSVPKRITLADLRAAAERRQSSAS